MRKWSLLIALAIVTSLPVLALAAVNNTAHDIDAYTGTGGYSGVPPATTGGTCSYCHLPHKAVGARLWPTAGTSGTGNWLSSANKVTPKLCNSCHNTSSTYALAQTVRPFEDTSHQSTVSNMTAWSDPALTADVRVDNTANLECTSCHDVHSNTYRPFLAWTTSTDIYENCAKCHSGRPNNTPNLGTANAGGQHPTNSTATDVTTMNFLATIDPAFTVAMGTSPGTASSTSWNLGGHYGAASTVRCQTCHNVHGTETVVAPNNLLAINNDNVASNLCQGCHEANPGATGTATHPINILPAAWTVTISPPAQWPFGTTGALVCSSCHDMHYASPNSSLFRRNGATTDAGAAALSTYGAFCAACHTTSSPTNWVHHPVGTVTGGTNLRAQPIASSATIAQVNWNTRTWSAAGPNYDFTGTSGTQMTCATCHSGGNAKAHNNTGSFPGLIGTVTESEMCVDCHSFNPSTYLQTKRGTTHTMSHFVGAIATAGYKKTTAFGNSQIPGTAIKYGTDSSPNGDIICESCHGLKRNASYAASAVKQISNNTGTNPAKAADVADNVSLLLERSGNANTDTTAANYLCTACHGTAPGGGSTHPTLPTMATTASAGLVTTVTSAGANTGVAGGRATLNNATDLRVNCESCHRPHNATSGTGALILESQVTTPASAKPAFELSSGASYMNQEGLCTRCHSR